LDPRTGGRSTMAAAVPGTGDERAVGDDVQRMQWPLALRRATGEPGPPRRRFGGGSRLFRHERKGVQRCPARPMSHTAGRARAAALRLRAFVLERPVLAFFVLTFRISLGGAQVFVAAVSVPESTPEHAAKVRGDSTSDQPLLRDPHGAGDTPVGQSPARWDSSRYRPRESVLFLICPLVGAGALEHATRPRQRDPIGG
jgi:hypothetical protein